MISGQKTGLFTIVSSLFFLGGCASFSQDANEVLIRNPKIGHYSPPYPAEQTAKIHWEYAVMSENAYQEGRASVAAKRTEFQRALDYSNVFSKAAFENACIDETKAIPLQGWRKWDFPSKALQSRMLREGMYFEVLERELEPHTIVVVFEGTNFSELPDWKANLRWFLRFIPGFKDQYTLAAKDVAEEFLAEIKSKPSKYRFDGDKKMLVSADGTPIKIMSTGHSLGGGLAQHFAYTFKQEPIDGRGPKVSEVFAFDSSPVTGWFSVSDPPRSYNADGLTVNRMFEHGEVLAYIRLFTSRLAIRSENPAIWEYRYNFDPKAKIIKNHSMRGLACGLAAAAEPWKSR
jgi:hypothetical protein